MLIKKVLGLVVTIVLLTSTSVLASMYDLTTAGSSVEIEKGLFYNWLPDNRTITGTDIFLEIQSSPTEEGVNIDSPLYFNTIFAMPLQLKNIPTVEIDNIIYREFLLDINEPGSIDKAFLSLNQLKIYSVNDTFNIFNDLDTELNTIYSLGLDTDNNDNWIKLDYNLIGGGGNSIDMFVYIPDSSFVENNEYVYLYSKFGENFDSEDGSEKWLTAVPIPSTVWIFGAGLIGLVGIRRKIKK